MEDKLSDLLSTCTNSEHFRSLISAHRELVALNAGAVFKRLEIVGSVSPLIYTELRTEIDFLLSLPMSAPVEPEACIGDIRPLDEIERDYIIYAIQKYDFNVQKCADALGISLKGLKLKFNNYFGKRDRDIKGHLRIQVLSYLSESSHH